VRADAKRCVTGRIRTQRYALQEVKEICGRRQCHSYAVVYLVLVYLYWQSYETKKRHGKTTSLSEVLARLRADHQRAVLQAACKEAAGGTPVEVILERYLGEATPTAA
jgi:hypothetical protein